MARVEFGDNKYNYFNTNGTVLFSSDSSHNYLFDYVHKNLSELPLLFDQYISSKIDTTTFELKDTHNDGELIFNEMKKKLASIHPYYELQCENVILDEIGKYYNSLLVYSCYNKHTLAPDLPENSNWYFENLQKLIPYSLINDIFNAVSYTDPTSYINNFRDQYKNIIGMAEHNNDQTEVIDEVETLIYVPKQSPNGFSDEIKTHNIICNMLFYILDITVPDLKELSIHQRIWLYDKIFASSNNYTNLTVIKHLDFHSSCSSDISNIPNIMHNYQNFLNLTKLNAVCDGIPASEKKSLTTVIEYAKTIPSVTNVYEEYEINELRELLYLEVLSMIQNGTMIRKCKNCDKYFIVNNRKTAYCDRIDESGMYCSAVGSKKNFQKKMEKEDALKIYNRAYKTHHARVRNKIMSQDEFSQWYTEAKSKLEKVRNGYLDIDEFEKWLKL